MSDVPPRAAGAGPAGAGTGGDQPSEEELRAYLSQLREAPADQVLAEVLSGLLNAAQVKLGRGDGRLLLDVVAGAVDAGRDRLPAELTKQVDDVVSQLRIAQVEAERELAGRGEADPSDLAGAPGGAAGAGSGDAEVQRPDGSGDQGGGDATSRLWIPGR